MTNPYEQYVEDSIMTATPVQLVTMLYRCALESLADARHCLATGDIAGRAKPVSRVFDVVTELLTSLDHERGGELSQRLAGLYTYIQNTVLMGHIEQDDTRFAEAESLLRTLAESWETIAAAAPPAQPEAVQSGISYSY